MILTFLFEVFVKLGLWVWEVIGKIAKAFGLGKGDAETYGKLLGTIFGILLGIKAFKFINNVNKQDNPYL